MEESAEVNKETTHLFREIFEINQHIGGLTRIRDACNEAITDLEKILGEALAKMQALDSLVSVDYESVVYDVIDEKLRLVGVVLSRGKAGR